MIESIRERLTSRIREQIRDLRRKHRRGDRVISYANKGDNRGAARILGVDALTAKDALAELEASAQDLVSVMVEDIEALTNLLVPEEYRSVVLGRSDIADRWQTPPASLCQHRPAERAEGMLHGLMSALVIPQDNIEGRGVGVHLASFGLIMPTNVKMTEATSWALGQARALGASKEAIRSLTELREELEPDAPAPFIEDHIQTPKPVSTYGIGLMFLFVQDAPLIERSAPSIAIVPVDKPPAHTYSAMGGADQEIIGQRRRRKVVQELVRDPETEVASMDFKWADNDQTRWSAELQLELDFYSKPGTGALMAVGQKYGDIAVRDMMGLTFTTWVSRAWANQAVTIWPNEQLELVGLKPSKDNRAAFRTRLEAIKRSRLTVHYRDGLPLSGPLINEHATDGDAIIVSLHPALYRGITNERGEDGRYFCVYPREVLQLPARGSGKVHLIVPVLGSCWRASLGTNDGPVARLKTESLADSLGIRSRSDRRFDAQVVRQLRQTLNSARDSGLIGECRLPNGGSLKSPGAVIEIRPGARIRDALTGGGARRPPWVPSTGEQLGRWAQANGWSFREAGQAVGLEGNRLARLARTHADRPLPYEVRQAVRRFMWGA